jgi:hypothetical protein
LFASYIEEREMTIKGLSGNNSVITEIQRQLPLSRCPAQSLRREIASSKIDIAISQNGPSLLSFSIANSFKTSQTQRCRVFAGQLKDVGADLGGNQVQF